MCGNWLGDDCNIEDAYAPLSGVVRGAAGAATIVCESGTIHNLGGVAAAGYGTAAISTNMRKAKVALPKMYVESYVCPSDAVKTRTGTAMSYVANGGLGHQASNQVPANGAFVNRVTIRRWHVVEGHWKDGQGSHAWHSANERCRHDTTMIGWNGFTRIRFDQFDEPRGSQNRGRESGRLGARRSCGNRIR